MYSAFRERTKRSIDALKRHLITSDAMRSAIHDGLLVCKSEIPCFDQRFSRDFVPTTSDWRVIDHGLAVTRIYAVYEQFAHEMIREHLVLMQTNIKFIDLPQKIQKSYRNGIAEILNKKESMKYKDLDLTAIVTQYHNALAGGSYTLEAKAMLIQEQNLRLVELNRLFSGSGIGEIGGWIDRHRSVEDFFKKDSRLNASAEREMAQLVEYRNDAAHGSVSVDNILALDYLLEFCDFIAPLCDAILEIVQLIGLKFLSEAGRAITLGHVSELLKNNTVLIFEMRGKLCVGDTIYLKGKNYCFEREVISIQIDDVNQTRVDLTIPQEVGVAINGIGSRKAQIISLVPAPVH
jgi:MAE_28990/MAE_18760-like HEPN